jgi:hypothetical protein
MITKTRFAVAASYAMSILVTVLIASSVGAQVRLASCAEVPSSTVNASRHRTIMRTDCDREQAIALASAKAGENAASALGSVCRTSISIAEASSACRTHGLTAVLAQPSGGLNGDVFRVPGSPRVDFALPISPSQTVHLCVVVRNLAADFELTTQEDNMCPMDGGRRTIVRAGVRARCGVQCF